MTRPIWFSHAGEFAKGANHTRAMEKKLIEHFGGGRSYMRVGRFSVVIGSNDVVAAKLYAENVCDDGSIKKGSKFYDRSRSDRLSQVERVERAIKPEHPLYADIMSDIAAERAHWNK